jgi:hypothetical protein
MLFKYFYHLRRAPYKTRACFKLVNALNNLGQRQTFNHMRAICQDRESLLNGIRMHHYAHVAQRIITVWHSITVQEKIAKMFFKRKYLSALQDYIFDKNYIKPASIREHLLKRKAFKALTQLRGNRWKKDRRSLIQRAFMQKHRLSTLRKVFNKLLDNILVQKRKRIIMGTVTDFRKHNLSEKVFRLWKIFRNERKKKEIMVQVADEFRQ